MHEEGSAMTDRKPYTSIMMSATPGTQPTIYELPDSVAVDLRDTGISIAVRFDEIAPLDALINALCEARVRLADLRAQRAGA